MNLSVIGLGRLGLPFCFFLASKGYKVFGYDKMQTINTNIINNKKNFEPKLNHYIKKYKNKFYFENSIKNLIKKTNTTFLVLPTPSQKDGSFSNNYIYKCLKEISAFIKLKKNKKHKIIITSTTSPGSCEKFIIYLEKMGLKNNYDFSIVYNPHFIAQGTTIENLEKPDLILVGTDNNKTKSEINNFYNKIYKRKVVIKNTNFKEGEISKIAINCYITTKISFANFISELSEKSKNTDAKKILDAIGQDKRIGHSYLKVGTKFSGPCFPRDNYALINYSRNQGLNPFIANATNQTNSQQSNRILKIIKKISKNNKLKLSLGICGLTYKSDTNLILDSQGDSLIKDLSKKKIKFKRINIFDEFLNNKEIYNYNNKLIYFKNFKFFLKKSDIVLLMYPTKYENVIENFKSSKQKYIIDFWRRIKKVDKKVILIEFGKSI